MITESLLGDLKYRFRYGNMVVKLVFINLAVFIAFGIFYLISFLLQSFDAYELILRNLEVPASLTQMIKQPWSVFTYMFLHKGIFHVLFNMLWLYWFGEIFVLYLGDKKVLPLYIIGGLSGATLYVLAFNFIPVFRPMLEVSYMLGASASVFAIVFAATALNPKHEIRLLFFGDVKIVYIAFISLLLSLLNIANGNPGGNIAHVGGALSGYLFIKALQSGFDVSSPFTTLGKFFSGIFKRSSKMKVSYGGKNRVESSKPRGTDDQQKVDEILDKIARSGYDSLTKEEKDFLFHYSKK